MNSVKHAVLDLAPDDALVLVAGAAPTRDFWNAAKTAAADVLAGIHFANRQTG